MDSINKQKVLQVLILQSLHAGFVDNELQYLYVRILNSSYIAKPDSNDAIDFAIIVELNCLISTKLLNNF